ncbi:DNA mismatch repair protein MutS [Clostridium massiliamazoniense]|uniref:DNA mismatch repair protein MutS n=1 Tax=Clostridium massiliamazoniense TaxID=1347366 RepID=UPI0006D84943|nr:DNA mismatch repair protein MutS [Clostridium massiliamazoniense]
MALTPMMRQYMEIKEKYQDCILFFRLGDFYEMFFEDAKTASKELELVLTGRDCGLEEKAPMCGIPFHAANSYISRLVLKGYKVAIGEQVEDPSVAKGIVKRDVVKVITPGTYVDSTNAEYQNTYISAIFLNENGYSISSSDISTGEFKVTSFQLDDSLLLDELSKINPKEILIDSHFDSNKVQMITSIIPSLITIKDFSLFSCSEEEMISQFNNYSDADLDINCKVVSSVLMKYIFETQKMTLSNINILERYYIVNYMTIDSSSRRNLELTESLKEKNKKGSLIWVMDKSATSMGGRTLRKWIEEPLLIKKEIEYRLDAVEELVNNIYLNEDLREALKSIYDIERIVGKISNQNVNAKELLSLKTSLQKIPSLKKELSNCSSPYLKFIYDNLDELSDIESLLTEGINEEAPITIKEGNIIKDNYNEEVDSLRIAKVNGKEWIVALENKEREFTGIKSLKVGYNKVFGYYIEISKANYNLIPEGRYIRKQTLSNAERFITQELKEMEDKILNAEENLTTLEYNLFIDIRNKVEKQINRLKETAKLIGILDCLSTLALIANENNYVKPKINEEGIIEILDGRHPVVEKVIDNGEFVANNTLIDLYDNEILLITGPNMAGKSTYMRQVALISIMAQIGSFVPANKANISICDKVFTRIGASDDLAGGKSTFMVEMWEVSNILKNATAKSLVLLDEVGRGTSTYDGLSIAWSVIEYISKNLKCKTMFATHYHELTKLEGMLKGVKNYSVAVKELEDNIVFLRKIVEGGADQSYGIEVAKIAGLPENVIKRAKDILKDLEDNSFKENMNSISTTDIKDDKNILKETTTSEEVATTKIEKTKNDTENIQLSFSTLEKDTILNNIANLDVLSMTPMDAMNELYKLIKEAKQLI